MLNKGVTEDEEEQNRLDRIHFFEAMIRIAKLDVQLAETFVAPVPEPVPESFFERLDRFWFTQWLFSRWWRPFTFMGTLWSFYFLWLHRRNV